MGKRLQVALAVLASLGLGMVAWEVLRQQEPVYQGKPLSRWLSDLDIESDQSPDPAIRAVRTIGTNALPVLIKMVRAQDPLWKRSLLAFNARQSFIQLHISPASIVRSRAVQGYAALGAAAKEGVAALISVLDSQASDEVRSDAAAALGAIGPEAKAAIPALWKATQNGNPQLRKSAFLALANIQRWDQNAGIWRRF